MPSIILIAAGTKRPVNEIGDFVEVNPNNNPGPSYSAFKVIPCPDMTKEEIEEKIKSFRAETRMASEDGDKFRFDDNGTVEMWNDGGTWKHLEKRPHHMVNLNLTPLQIAQLGNRKTSPLERINILDGATDKMRNVENDVVMRTR